MTNLPIFFRQPMLMNLLSLALVCFLLSTFPPRAAAQCAAPPLQGTWHNVEPKLYPEAGAELVRIPEESSGAVKIQIWFIGGCDDTNTGDSALGAKVRVWFACIPSLCDWGEARAKVVNKNHLIIQYDPGLKPPIGQNKLPGGGWPGHNQTMVIQLRSNRLWVETTAASNGNELRGEDWFGKQSSGK
jgi:hypothetical protein